jgi:hypothetical protein
LAREAAAQLRWTARKGRGATFKQIVALLGSSRRSFVGDVGVGASGERDVVSDDLARVSGFAAEFARVRARITRPR